MKRSRKIVFILSLFMLAGGEWYAWDYHRVASKPNAHERLYLLAEEFRDDRIDSLEFVDASLAEAVDALNRKLDALPRGGVGPRFRVWKDGDALLAGMRFKSTPGPEVDLVTTTVGSGVNLLADAPTALPGTDGEVPEVPGPASSRGLFQVVAMRKVGETIAVTATISNGGIHDVARTLSRLFAHGMAGERNTILFYPENKIEFDLVERQYYLLSRGQAEDWFDVPKNVGRQRFDMRDWFTQQGVEIPAEGDAYHDPRDFKIVLRARADEVELASIFFSGMCGSAAAASSPVDRLKLKTIFWYYEVTAPLRTPPGP